MTTVRLQEFKLEDDHIEIVYNFNFLGSIICDDANGKKEIQRRLAMDRSFMTRSTVTKLAKIKKGE